jgi:hypothetical protein
MFTVSVAAAFLGPVYLSIYIRVDFDMSQFFARLGSDSLTLAGFVLASLAIIAKQIDRPIFNGIRLDESFYDIWRTFALTATVFFLLAIVVKATEMFYVLDPFTPFITFLFIFGIQLLMMCIYLLFRVVSLINADAIQRLKKETETPVDISVGSEPETTEKPKTGD